MIQRREVREVAHHLRLGDLGKRGSAVAGAASAAGAPRRPSPECRAAAGAARDARRPTARGRRFDDRRSFIAGMRPPPRGPRRGSRSSQRRDVAVHLLARPLLGHGRPGGRSGGRGRSARAEPRPGAFAPSACSTNDRRRARAAGARTRGRRERRERADTPGSAASPLGQVVRPLEALVRDLAHPLRAREAPGRSCCAQRQQPLVRADVGGRLLAADVLLARLEREHEPAAPVAVDGLADEPARQPADVRLPDGEEADERTAVATSERRAAAPPRRRCRRPARPEESAPTARSDRRPPPSRRPAACAASVSAVPSSTIPSKFGCAQRTPRRPTRATASRRPGSVRPCRRAAIVHDLEVPAPRRRCAAPADSADGAPAETTTRRPVRRAGGQERRLGGGGRAVVHGRVGHVHAGQLARSSSGTRR